MRAGFLERRDQMRRARRIRPVIEGNGNAARRGAVLIDAADDRRPVPEGDAKRNQGSASAFAASVRVPEAVTVRSPRAA